MWSTRETTASELDRIASKLQEQWSYTLDRSKILNSLCNALFKAEQFLDKSTISVVGQDTLEEAIVKAICQSRSVKSS